MKKMMLWISNLYNSLIDKYGEKKVRVFSFLITFLLSSFLCFLGTAHGYDTLFHLARVQALADGLMNGEFPVLVYPNYLHGYGYANGIFYPDVFLYIPAFLVCLGVRFDLAYSIYLMLINLVCIFTMYYCVKKITGNEIAALISSRLYVLSSYYLCDMFVRAAIGETSSFMFTPLVILGLYEIIFGDEKKNGWYFTVGIVGIMCCHIISTVLCIVLTTFIVLFNAKRLLSDLNRVKYLFIYGLLSIGIAAFIWLPELDMLLSDTFIYQSFEVLMSERVVTFWKAFIELPIDSKNSFGRYNPPGIGLCFVYLFIRSLFKKTNNEKLRSFYNCCIFGGFFFTIVSTDIIPWKYISILNIIQLPWRLFQLATALLVVGVSIYLSTMEDRNELALTDIVLYVMNGYTILCLLVNLFINNYYFVGFSRKLTYYIAESEYVPAIVDMNYIKERGEEFTSNNDFEFSYTKKGTDVVVKYSGNNYSDSYVEIPLLYYKGYAALDGKTKLDVVESENGLVQVMLNGTEGEFHVYYSITPSRYAGWVIAGGSLVVFLVLIRPQRKVKTIA